MKRFASIVLLLLCLTSYAFATDVCGNVSGVWDSERSPYMVICDVTVPNGQSLNIEPGVQVLFTGHYRFIIYGALFALGTAQDSIVFTRQFPNENSNWWGIRFHNQSDDSSRMEYCVVEYSFKPEGNDHDTNGGGILCENASPTFAHCTFRFNTASRGGGIMGFEASAPTVTGCLFSHNSAPYGAGYFTGTLGASITNTTIAENFQDGMYNVADVELVNTIIAFNGGMALTASENVTAHYCNFFGNAEGIGAGFTEQLTTVNSNGDSCDPFFNIFSDPLFEDTLTDNFFLQIHSPCIDAGDPMSPHDPDNTISDIGAFPRKPTGTLRGVVRIEASGLLMPGVSVFANGIADTVHTDSNGIYLLYLDPGTYSVSFRKSGFCGSTVTNVVIIDTLQTNLDIRMLNPTINASVTSILVETSPGRPITVNFEIRNQTGNCPLSYAITDTSAWLSTQPSNGTVGPAASQAISVTCDPTMVPMGADPQSSLTITHNASANPIVIPVELFISVDASLPNPTFPIEYALHPAYPNPFNATTSLRFDLPQESHVKLTIFNIMGQVVGNPVNKSYSAGRHAVEFTAKDLPSGMYIVGMDAGNFSSLNKLILLK